MKEHRACSCSVIHHMIPRSYAPISTNAPTLMSSFASSRQFHLSSPLAQPLHSRSSSLPRAPDVPLPTPLLAGASSSLVAGIVPCSLVGSHRPPEHRFSSFDPNVDSPRCPYQPGTRSEAWILALPPQWFQLVRPEAGWRLVERALSNCGLFRVSSGWMAIQLWD